MPSFQVSVFGDPVSEDYMNNIRDYLKSELPLRWNTVFSVRRSSSMREGRVNVRWIGKPSKKTVLDNIAPNLLTLFNYRFDPYRM